MNNAKIWLVVKPTVGVPLFLGAVAVGSFAVHVAVLSYTTWYNDYLTGQPLGTTAEAAAAVAAPEAASASYATTLDNGDRAVTVTLPDGTTARAILQPNDVLASASVVPPTMLE